MKVFILLCFVFLALSGFSTAPRKALQNPPFPLQCVNKDMDPETDKPEFKGKLHKELRQRVLDQLKQNTRRSDGIVFIEGRQPGNFFVEQKQIVHFTYFSGVFVEGYQMVVNVSNGESILFAPVYTENDRVWSYAHIPTLQEIRHMYGVDKAFWKTDLEKIVRELKPSVVYTLPNQKLPFSSPFPHQPSGLQQIIDQLRSIKTDNEIRVMRVGIKTSSLAHVEVMKHTREKLMEYQLQTVFESNCKVCGMKWQSYPPIVGGGNRSAVLHYVANDRMIPTSPDSNILLIDASGDYLGYASDITRTYPANGKFTQEQKMIYQTVLNAQKDAIETLKEGSLWSNAVLASHKAILSGLKSHGFLTGDINAMHSARVQNLFMLHGLGHHLGLNVHDSGYLSTMRENMVVTVEPGIYFHEFIFRRATPEQKRFLNDTMIKKFLGFGGVRIEDCIRVLRNGYENLSKDVPKEIDEIEKLMKQ